MSWLDDVILLATGAIGGVLNSVAGGGSFLTFPALLLVGVAPITANATSAVALWPASLAAAVAYRRDLQSEVHLTRLLCAASILGGLLGAILLLGTSNTTFTRVLPYLLLLATSLFHFGPRLTQWLRRSAPNPSAQRLPPALAALLQFVIAFYGGYFGGGMGIMMLATLTLLGMTQIHQMNALKTLLATLINLAAIAMFIGAGKVVWRAAILMAIAATLGGYFGAASARKLNPGHVRGFVLAVAWSLTAYFFVRAWR